eukprot:scaffold13339_cov28-Tisochrysis_lutea.AAC.4
MAQRATRHSAADGSNADWRGVCDRCTRPGTAPVELCVRETLLTSGEISTGLGSCELLSGGGCTGPSCPGSKRAGDASSSRRTSSALRPETLRPRERSSRCSALTVCPAQSCCALSLPSESSGGERRQAASGKERRRCPWGPPAAHA